MSKKISANKKTGMALMNNPELGSKFVIASRQVKPGTSDPQVFRIGGKLYQVRQLG